MTAKFKTIDFFFAGSISVLSLYMLRSSFSPDLVEAGCDEVGRGCLAGPVVAAAVILPKNYQHENLNDSKQLTREDRELLRKDIERDAIGWAIAEVDNNEIDQINILNASFKAMHVALDNLKLRPELLLIDGNRFKPYGEIRFECIIKGDATYLSIAAASVLAKTYRDELMQTLHAEFPHYDWDKNKAYPTLKHRASIREHGTTGYHRMTFNLLGGEKKAITKRKK